MQHFWWRVVAGLITHQLLCERPKRLFIPTGAMRLQYRPVLRHLRSLIGPPTSDDERQSILLQFVRTDSDLRRGPQSRVSHSRSISYFEFAVRRRATPSGSETQSRFALPTQPTQQGHCPTAPYICRKLSAPTWMCRSDLVATTTRPPKWNQAELTRLAEDAPTGNERVTRSSTTSHGRWPDRRGSGVPLVISARSLFYWQKEHAEFLQAIQEGRQRSQLSLVGGARARHGQRRGGQHADCDAWAAQPQPPRRYRMEPRHGKA